MSGLRSALADAFRGAFYFDRSTPGDLADVALDVLTAHTDSRQTGQGAAKPPSDTAHTGRSAPDDPTHTANG